MPAKTEDIPANDNARPVRKTEQMLQQDPALRRQGMTADEADGEPIFSPGPPEWTER